MSSPALKKLPSTAIPSERLVGVKSASGAQSATLSREQQLLGLQGKAGNQAVQLVLDETSLEKDLLNLPRLPREHAVTVLRRFLASIENRIISGERRILAQMALRAESFSNYLIGGAIEVFGLTSLPSDDWNDAWGLTNRGRDQIQRGQIREALETLVSASKATTAHWKLLNDYLESTDKGTDRSVFTLQVLQAAGALAATALTGGGATAVAVGAGYGATQNLAGQATSVAIGIQAGIDWGGMAFDTLFGVLTGAGGGRLGNAVLKRLMGRPEVARLGRRVIAEVVSDLVSGRLSSILHTVGRGLFDELRGKEQLTVDQFIERLADQLMDPKGMFIDAIMGRAAKITYSRKAAGHGGGLHHSKEQTHVAGTTNIAASANPPKLPPTRPSEPVQTKTVSQGKTASSVRRESASTAAHEGLSSQKSPTPTEENGLELDLSGSRKNWNKHLEEYQVIEAAKLDVKSKKAGFREASKEKGGTEHHTGMHFHEYSAAEVAIRLRVDWDPQAGRPRMVSYIFAAEAAAVPAQATKRSFHQEQRLKGESAQSREKAYLKSGYERGHLAQREAGKVGPETDSALGLKESTGPEVERSLDVLTNVAPMKPLLNKGSAWRSAETRTAQHAAREGYVEVEITPIYDSIPPRLSDGTPIPSQFRRVIKSGLTGNILEDIRFDNK
jgi:DNA/RNA endonuclease G (NUC1)